MPRDVVALVSADDFVSAVRVYADRVNDLLRRSGVPALEAIEVSETQALALLDAVVNAPDTVIDLAGWWFARAIEFTSRTDRFGAVDVEEPISMLAGTAGEEQVRDALETLPDAERAAVVLRDAYDLPPQAVGVALRRGTESAAELTAAGRLHLVAAYDSRRVPDLSGHSGRTTVDVVSLSKLAEGTLESPRAAPLRRHAGNCTACEDVLESLARGRRLAAGLPIIAMDDDARESMIERIAGRAVAVLPTHEAVLRAVDEDHDPGPTISPVIAVIVLAIAVSLGVAIGVLSRSTGAAAPATTPIATTAPVVTPSFSISPSHHPRRPKPTLSPSPSISASMSTTPTTSATPTISASSSPPVVTGPALIVLSPNAGPSGTRIEVLGSGWRPDTTVIVRFGFSAPINVAVNSSGEFHAFVTANSLLPGRITVRTHEGARTATAVFIQQL